MIRKSMDIAPVTKQDTLIICRLPRINDLDGPRSL